MTTSDYLKTLAKLDLQPAGKATAAALGVSVRQLQYYASGAPIPKPVERILTLLFAARFAKESS